MGPDADPDLTSVHFYGEAALSRRLARLNYIIFILVKSIYNDGINIGGSYHEKARRHKRKRCVTMSKMVPSCPIQESHAGHSMSETLQNHRIVFLYPRVPGMGFLVLLLHTRNHAFSRYAVVPLPQERMAEETQKMASDAFERIESLIKHVQDNDVDQNLAPGKIFWILKANSKTNARFEGHLPFAEQLGLKHGEFHNEYGGRNLITNLAERHMYLRFEEISSCQVVTVLPRDKDESMRGKPERSQIAMVSDGVGARTSKLQRLIEQDARKHKKLQHQDQQSRKRQITPDKTNDDVNTSKKPRSNSSSSQDVLVQLEFFLRELDPEQLESQVLDQVLLNFETTPRKKPSNKLQMLAHRIMQLCGTNKHGITTLECVRATGQNYKSKYLKVTEPKKKTLVEQRVIAIFAKPIIELVEKQGEARHRIILEQVTGRFGYKIVKEDEITLDIKDVVALQSHIPLSSNGCVRLDQYIQSQLGLRVGHVRAALRRGIRGIAPSCRTNS